MQECARLWNKGFRGLGLEHLTKVLLTLNHHHFNSGLPGLEEAFRQALSSSFLLQQDKSVRDVMQAYRNVFPFAQFEPYMLKALDDAVKALQEAMTAGGFTPQQLQGDDLEADFSTDALFALALTRDPWAAAAPRNLKSEKDAADGEQPTAPFGKEDPRVLARKAMRFAWELHRVALDLLRNSARYETLYLSLCKRATAFCATWRRPSELIKLAETLRNHLHLAIKYPSQSSPIVLADTHQGWMEARMAVLDASLEMELWAEAQRCLEDLHALYSAARLNTRSLLMTAGYFERLIRIHQHPQHRPAAIIHCAVMEAGAWHRLHAIKGRKDPAIALSAILATLAIPVLKAPSVEAMYPWMGHVPAPTPEDLHYRNHKAASLLGLPRLPVFHGLVGDLKNNGWPAAVLSSILAESQRKALKDLFDSYLRGPKYPGVQDWLEKALKDLNLVLKEDLNKSLGHMLPAIEKNLRVKAVQSVAAHRDTISFGELGTILAYHDKPSSAENGKKDATSGDDCVCLVLQLLQEGKLAGDFEFAFENEDSSNAGINTADIVVRFDRRRYMLAAADEAALAAQIALAPSLRVDGWTFLMRQIDQLARKLSSAQPDGFDYKPPQTLASHISDLLADLPEDLKSDQQRRHSTLVQVRQKREELRLAREAREREEAKERAAHLLAEQTAVRKKLDEDAARKERDRQAQERQAIVAAEQAKAEEERARMQATAQLRANHDRILATWRKGEMLERALREASREAWLADAASFKQLHREAYDAKVKAVEALAREKHAMDVTVKARLPAMQADRDTFAAKVLFRRKTVWDQAQIISSQLFEEAKAQRILEQEQRLKEELEEQARLAEQEKIKKDEEAQKEKQESNERSRENEFTKQHPSATSADDNNPFAAFGTTKKPPVQARPAPKPTTPSSARPAASNVPSGSWRK